MKAIIFDFGGTLDTNGIHWSEFFWDVYQKFGVDVSKEEYERAYVEGENDFIPLSPFKGGFKDALRQQLSNQFSHLNSQADDKSKLIEKMADYCYNEASNCLKNSKEILSELKKDFKLGVVSNFYGNMAGVLKEFGIDVDAVVDSSLVGVKKPDKKIFEIALSKMGAKPEDTFVVGDSYGNDIVPAKAVGCKTIWLKGRSWNEQGDSSKADYVISSLEEVKQIIKTG